MASSDREYKIGIVVGESSGDLLAAGFMQAWLTIHPNTKFFGVGGPRMISLGFNSLFPLEDLNVMGLIEPLKRLPRLIKSYQTLKKTFLKNSPDCVIGVDFQEFNLFLEKALKKKGIKTVHYVGPTLWAWRPNRVYTVQKAADKVLVLFPFETAFYEKLGIDVTHVGRPFADEIPMETDIQAARFELNLKDEEPVLAILPGSRTQEISTLAEPFIKAALLLKQEIPRLKIICAAVNDHKAQQCKNIFQQLAIDARIVVGKSRLVIAASDAVLVSSGSATLECMLMKKPMVVAYRIGKFTYWLAKKLITIPYIAMPNILAKEQVVKEIIQEDVTPENLKEALLPYFNQTENSVNLKDKFYQMHTMLRKNASIKAAQAIDAII